MRFIVGLIIAAFLLIAAVAVVEGGANFFAIPVLILVFSGIGFLISAFSSLSRRN